MSYLAGFAWNLGGTFPNFDFIDVEVEIQTAIDVEIESFVGVDVESDVSSIEVVVAIDKIDVDIESEIDVKANC